MVERLQSRQSESRRDKIEGEKIENDGLGASEWSRWRRDEDNGETARLIAGTS